MNNKGEYDDDILEIVNIDYNKLVNNSFINYTNFYKHELLSKKQNNTIYNDKESIRPVFLNNNYKFDIEYNKIDIKDDIYNNLLHNRQMLEQKKDLLLKNIPCENTLKKNFTSIDTYNKKDISENLDTKYKLNNNSGVDNSNLINSIYTNNKKVTFKNKYNEESKINKKWKLYRVICGHTGWVRCVDIDPTNHW